MDTNLLSQLSELRTRLAEVPGDSKQIYDYAWTIVKALLQHTTELDSLTARQLLAECLKLPTERPSRLHSALLSAAVKVASVYPDFRFAAFLQLWDIENLRPEDHQRQQATSPQSSSSLSACGEHVEPSSLTKPFPSLAEKTARTLAHSLLLHPEDRPSLLITPSTPLCSQRRVAESSLLSTYGLSLHPLLVTRIKQAEGKDGRKYTFVTLTSPEGLEVETTSHLLQPSPLHPLPEGKRHYVNIGQLYDCLLKTKAPVPADSSAGNNATVLSGSPSDNNATLSPCAQRRVAEYHLTEAVLSKCATTEVFPTEIGYLESIDQQHGHMHVFDAHSRHFVAPVQRFSRERVGDFVRFIPIVPAVSKFKTAIIQGTIPVSVLSATVPSDSSEGQPILREIRITHINQEKGYASWELTDKSHPITELLSPLQLSQGETSPTFTSGYLNLTEELSSSLSLSSTLKAFIYLRRGKDRQKRPHIARLF